MQIDLEQRKHSSMYEIKPMNPLWMVGAFAFLAAMVAASGATVPSTWAMFVAGVIVTIFAILCFPRVFLAKRP
jgi:hypothetical protein